MGNGASCPLRYTVVFIGYMENVSGTVNLSHVSTDVGFIGVWYSDALGSWNTRIHFTSI